MQAESPTCPWLPAGEGRCCDILRRKIAGRRGAKGSRMRCPSPFLLKKNYKIYATSLELCNHCPKNLSFYFIPMCRGKYLFMGCIIMFLRCGVSNHVQAKNRALAEALLCTFRALMPAGGARRRAQAS